MSFFALKTLPVNVTRFSMKFEGKHTMYNYILYFCSIELVSLQVENVPITQRTCINKSYFTKGSRKPKGNSGICYV